MAVIVLVLMRIETVTTQPIPASDVAAVKQMVGNDL
jgi:hypothetical protein